MSNSSTRMVTLESLDGEIFVVEESVAVQSGKIMNTIEKDGRSDRAIRIGNVSGKILSKVIEFCRRKHSESTAAASPVDKKEIKAWEYEFVRVDKATLQGLSEASAKLKIDSLMELTFQTLKDMATGIAEQGVLKKTRIQYDIVNDPPEEKDLSIRNYPQKERELGKESPEYTKAEESELLKQCNIRQWLEPPREIDLLKNLGKESTKAEESELSKQYNIPQWLDPPKEIDFLKNLGKESTKAEEKARGKRKFIE